MPLTLLFAQQVTTSELSESTHSHRLTVIGQSWNICSKQPSTAVHWYFNTSFFTDRWNSHFMSKYSTGRVQNKDSAERHNCLMNYPGRMPAMVLFLLFSISASKSAPEVNKTRVPHFSFVGFLVAENKVRLGWSYFQLNFRWLIWF